jgi:hypothetical protein
MEAVPDCSFGVRPGGLLSFPIEQPPFPAALVQLDRLRDRLIV